MMAFRRKVYGQSKEENCRFCQKRALTENSQGIPTCHEHKSKTVEDKTCTCGELLEIKKSKWGQFFLCRNCGPVSPNKADLMDQDGFKLNKKYRKPPKEIKYEKDRVYTLGELEELWD